jgi:hypothetical protein
MTCLPLVLAALLAGSPASAWVLPPSGLPQIGGGLPIQPVQLSAPLAGTYRGSLPDGRVLFQTLRVISPDLITLIAHDHTAQPVAYRLVGPGLFRAAGGASIEITGQSELRWSRGEGSPVVIYGHQP